jgi:hypothetical protein
MKNGTTKEGKREGRYKKEKEMLRGFLIFKAILKRYDDVFCCFGVLYIKINIMSYMALY